MPGGHPVRTRARTGGRSRVPRLRPEQPPDGQPSLSPAIGGLVDGTLALDRFADPAGIVDLQRQAGNQAVSHLLVQRITDEALAAKAGDSGQAYGAGAPAKPFSLGATPSPEKQKSALEEIRDIVDDNWWVGPLDELKLGRLWSSFGEGLPQVYDANKGLWDKSRDRGMDLRDVGILNIARTQLAHDVRGIAREYMEKNLADAVAAQKELGFEPGGAPPTDEQVERRNEIEWAATQLSELKKIKSRLEMQFVGWTEVPSRVNQYGEDFGGLYPVRFTPGRAPSIPAGDPRGNAAVVHENVVPYDDVMKEWQPVTGALLSLADEHPVLFAALRENKLGQVAGEDATDNPAGAMQTVLANLITSIKETKGNIDSGALKWQELKPIHRQLVEGERKVRIPWDHPVFKAAAKESVGSFETGKTVADIGIGVAAAVMFIFAMAASGGTAAIFLLGGLGLSAGNAASKWKDYGELKSAAKAAASSTTELVGQEQVDAALIEAILESAFAALDVFQAGKGAKAIAGGMKAARAGAKAATVEGVEELAKAVAKGAAPDVAGRALIERSIVEQGVEATMKRMGQKDPLKLLALVPEASVAAARIKDYASLVAKLGADVDLPSVLTNLAKKTAELGAAEVDGFVRLAIERYGPLKTIQMSGGWKNLASALGGDSAAGKSLLAWRDAIYGDLKSFVEKDLKAAVQETGTIGNFTNDLDMSFLGKEAAAHRSTALQYLAGRAGLPANAGMLDKMLYIGLFTDPRRLHLFDKFPDLAADLSKKTAGFEEQLIWNAELSRLARNPIRQQRVLDAMKELGIPVMEKFKPLSDTAVDLLSKAQDRLVGEIEELANAATPDKGALSAKMLELAQVQAQINVKEGGGYFSAGGVRRFVSQDPKNPFPGYKPGEAPAKPGSMEYTAALDQVAKLRDASDKLAGAVVQGPAGLADVAGSMKSIAKYGDRFVEAAKALGVSVPDPKLFDEMAGEFKRILELARRETGETLQATLRSDFDTLMSQVTGAVARFDSLHVAVLKDLRMQAGILGKEAVAADIVKATVSKYRWARFRSLLFAELALAGRVVNGAERELGDQLGGSGPAAAPAGAGAAAP
jgi:hypothetical protein